MPRSICIATPDIIGPVRNGGIGSACFEIAKTWAAAGHDVTVLFVNFSGFSESANESWLKEYDALGISFKICPQDSCIGVPGPLQLAWNAWQWLKNQPFDAIYFPEWRGIGLYTIQAKKAGLGFHDTQMIVGAHSPSLWHSSGGWRFPSHFEELMVDAAERQSVAFADMLVSPSQYMVDYMRGEGWELPADVRVIPNPFDAAVKSSENTVLTSIMPVREIVFFGRLEKRKGLEIFVKALSIIPKILRSSLQVTFLGKPGSFQGGALKFIADSRLDGFAGWNVIDDHDSQCALAYLSVPGRLAIMASLTENSPMTVRECIAIGVPFLASNVGGIPEMIAGEDHSAVLFSPKPAELASVITRQVKSGVAPVRSAFNEDVVKDQWYSVLEFEAPQRQNSIELAKVSVVITTFNRASELEQVLIGLRAQTFTNFEVILVDDGSTDPAAISKLDSLSTEFAANNWKIIRQENKYLGAARNTGWRNATGDFVIFHDDDNYSCDTLVETYARALITSNADIATCTMAPYTGKRPKGSSLSAERVFPFIGNAWGAGLYGNLFGDAHACFRRSALEEVGGFTEDYGVGHEDWEIFARASLRGLKIINVPEPLFWYREHESSMLRGRTSRTPDYMRSLRPYLDEVPSMLRPALQLASSQFLQGTPPQSVTDTPSAQEDLVDLAFVMLPRRLRSEAALRRACTGEITWLSPIWQGRIPFFEMAALRRLNCVGAKRAKDMTLLELVLAGLPRQLQNRNKIIELASFGQSWERVLWRHPQKISYWKSARSLQHAVRRRRRA